MARVVNRAPAHVETPLAGLRRDVLHVVADVLLGLRGIGSAASLKRATWAVTLAGASVISLLSLRVWLQLSGNERDGGILGLAYDAAGFLALPFKPFEPSTPVRENGILEF